MFPPDGRSGFRQIGYEGLANKAMADGIEDETIERLIGMLTIDEMQERRSAVQARAAPDSHPRSLIHFLNRPFSHRRLQ